MKDDARAPASKRSLDDRLVILRPCILLEDGQAFCTIHDAADVMCRLRWDIIKMGSLKARIHGIERLSHRRDVHVNYTLHLSLQQMNLEFGV